MAEKIYIADKQTLDSVKVDTTQIINELANTNTDINLINSILTAGVGTVWSKYSPKYFYNVFDVKEIPVGATILEISGEGFFSSLLFSRADSNTTNEARVILEIDGVRKGYIRHYANDKATGYAKKSDVSLENDKKLVIVGNLLKNIYPKQFDNGSLYNEVSLISSPIFFKNSFKLINDYKPSTSTLFVYEFMGGVIL